MRVFPSILFSFVLSSTILQGEGRFEIAPGDLPLVLTNSGSYVVTGPLVGVSGADGISVQADDVSIDLNGFSLKGAPGAIDGISVPVGVTGLRVANGVIAEWPDDGIDAIYASNSVFESLMIYTNANAGLTAGFNCLVDAVISFENGGKRGPESGSADNTEGSGIRIENGSVIKRTIVRNNNHHGLISHSASHIEAVVLWNNGHDGLHGSHATTVRALNAGGNSEGVEVDSGSVIRDSVSSLNVEDGFRFKSADGDDIAGGGLIEGCVASGNSDNGFDLKGRGVRIEESLAYSNLDHGIRLSTNMVARLNLAASQIVESGIHASDPGARIDGNHLVLNKQGLQAPEGATASLIVRNSAAENISKDYDVPASQTNYFTVTSFPGDALPKKPWVNFVH